MYSIIIVIRRSRAGNGFKPLATWAHNNLVSKMAYALWRIKPSEQLLYHWNEVTHITFKQTTGLTGNMMSALFIHTNGHMYRACPITTRKLAWNFKYSQRWSFRLWFSEIWCHVILCRDVPHFQHNAFAWNDGIYLLTNTASYLTSQ